MSAPTKEEKREHLAGIQRLLDNWGDGIKTSAYWRLESERARLICEGVELPEGAFDGRVPHSCLDPLCAQCNPEVQQ